jgi:hypothetical protein
MEFPFHNKVRLPLLQQTSAFDNINAAYHSILIFNQAVVYTKLSSPRKLKFPHGSTMQKTGLPVQYRRGRLTFRVVTTFLPPGEA